MRATFHRLLLNSAWFLTLSNIFLKSLWIGFICLSVRDLTYVNIFGLQCNWCKLLKLTVACSLLKIKSVPSIVHLQNNTKVFCYIMIYGEKLNSFLWKWHNLSCLSLTQKPWIYVSSRLCSWNLIEDNGFWI